MVSASWMYTPVRSLSATNGICRMVLFQPSIVVALKFLHFYPFHQGRMTRYRAHLHRHASFYRRQRQSPRSDHTIDWNDETLFIPWVVINSVWMCSSDQPVKWIRCAHGWLHTDSQHHLYPCIQICIRTSFTLLSVYVLDYWNLC